MLIKGILFDISRRKMAFSLPNVKQTISKRGREVYCLILEGPVPLCANINRSSHLAKEYHL